MDKPRRSLTAALGETEQIEQFRRFGLDAPKETEAPNPKRDTPTTASVRTGSKPDGPAEMSQEPKQAEDQAEQPEGKVAGRIPRKRTRRKPAASKEPLAGTNQPSTALNLSRPRVAITTRFSPETAEALRRTSLERRLSGQTPAAMQEIIEEAILDWLKRSGQDQP